MTDPSPSYDAEIAALQVAKLADQVQQYFETVDGLRTADSFSHYNIGLNDRHRATTKMEAVAETWEDTYDAVRAVVDEEYEHDDLADADTVEDPIGFVLDDGEREVETEPQSICAAYVAAEKALLEAEAIAEDLLGTDVRERAEKEPSIEYTPEVKDSEYGV